MLRDKEYKLLAFLGSRNEWSTAVLISRFLSCSVRSVKTYISDIHFAYPDLIQSSVKGYMISNKDRLPSILNDNPVKKDIPQDAEGRKAYILKSLLLDHQIKSIDELACELCISPTTLTNEISVIKAELGKFDLVFKTKNTYAFIDGLEKNKKKMISHLIYEETKGFLNGMEFVQTYFPNTDLKIIKHVVTETLLYNHYFMDDFSLANFILHIGITLEHSLKNLGGHELSEPANSVFVAAHIKELMIEICGELEKYFYVHFSDNDYADLALPLMTRIRKDNTDQLQVPSIHEIVEPYVFNLMEIIQKQVKDNFLISLSNDNFIIRFSLHLWNLLIRLENKIDLRNPQLLSIKNTYPYMYDVSVFIANIITQEKGFILSEDEIAYIALHIGVLIEEQKALREKVKVLIVCPKYYSSHIKLVSRIGTVFEESILVLGIITSLDELKSSTNYDLILSTVPINPYSTGPVVLISTYFDHKDIGNVANKIEQIKKARVKAKLENKLKFLFKKELFFYNPDFSDQNMVIDSMSDSLYTLGYVNETFGQRLYEREKISSSAYTNIAMPHPIEMCANKTAIAVAIHSNGIIWHTHKVNFVFMLAINEDDRVLFRDIFDFVTEIISDDKYSQALLNTKTYEEFINLLISSI